MVAGRRKSREVHIIRKHSSFCRPSKSGRFRFGIAILPDLRAPLFPTVFVGENLIF